MTRIACGGRLPLRHHVPVRLPDLALDPGGPRHRPASTCGGGSSASRRSTGPKGKKHPWEREWSYGWSMMRIGAYLRRQDMDLLDRWYATAGRALHVDGRKPHRPEVAEELLTEMGLDPGIGAGRHRRPDHRRRGARRARASWCRRAVSACPPWSSTTARRCSGRSWSTRPPGTAALRLWDLVTGWLEFPHLYELQRPKSRSRHRRHRRRPSPPTSRPATGSRSSARRP